MNDIKKLQMIFQCVHEINFVAKVKKSVDTP